MMGLIMTMILIPIVMMMMIMMIRVITTIMLMNRNHLICTYHTPFIEGFNFVFLFTIVISILPFTATK